MTEIDQRVLSVSYGSFSIQLEGFDDPFAIMRRVTEYFRSVTSLDPSFGQKPLIEDLTVLEAMETAIFADEVTLEQKGSTLTLRPKAAPQAEPQRDVFVLESTNLATEQALQTPAEAIQPNKVSEELLEATNEEQAALASTPLDLSEMAQNHQEMPFVRKEAVAEHVAAPEQPMQEEAEATGNSPIKRYRSLSMRDFQPVVNVKAPATAPTVDTSGEQTEKPVEASDLAVSLENQEPVEKRSLRIIRNDYAYEEQQAEEKPMPAPTPEQASVNPFRKFPKRETIAQPEPAPIPEAAPVDSGDDLVNAYRKLRAEHG